VSVAIGKIPGVTHVTVSLNQALVTADLSPANTVSLEQIRQAILADAFTPKEARVRVMGRVVSAGAQLRLNVSATNDSYDLVPAAGVKDLVGSLRKAAGHPVLVEGLIPAGSAKPPLLEVHQFSLSTEKGDQR
jgi:copper chaperone CopZ